MSTFWTLLFLLACLAGLFVAWLCWVFVGYYHTQCRLSYMAWLDKQASYAEFLALCASQSAHEEQILYAARVSREAFHEQNH